MNSDLSDFISDVWRTKPIVIIVAIVGFIIFVLLVIDTYRHRKKQKSREPKKH